MIVNYTESGWEVITQRSHGLLAGQICAHWRNESQPERWAETLIAAAEHDDVFNENENDDILNANGGPVDFKMTTFREDYARLMISRAVMKSTYVALLTARHIQFVHGKNKHAAPYIKELKTLEKYWKDIAGVTSAEIDKAYALLEFCDAFSLLICQGLIPPEGRSIDISDGPDGIVYRVSSEQENVLNVFPWPFDTSAFSLRFESRVLQLLQFRNVKHFRDAFQQATIEQKVVTVVKK